MEVLQHLEDVGVRGGDRVQRGPVQLEQLAVGPGGDRRAARLAGEDRDLAEEVALVDLAHLDVAPGGVAHEGLHEARW